MVDRHAQEQLLLNRNLTLAAALTLPVFQGEMGGHLFPPLHHWLLATLGHSIWWAIRFVLTAAVLTGPGRRFYRIGLPLLAKGAPDMNCLLALSSLAAGLIPPWRCCPPTLAPSISRPRRSSSP